jgi:hypothetical protein
LKRYHAGSANLRDTEVVKPSIEDLLAAPVGVALLDRLEAKNRQEFRPFEALRDSQPAAVHEAAEEVEQMSSGQLLSIALDASQYIAGPWSGGAPDSLALAYTMAQARAAIAEALWERFADDLIRPLEPALQQCWISDTEEWEPVARFRDFDRVYGNGEFPWDGFWTVTEPPSEIHDDLISAWEMMPGPITRWRLPLRPDSRLWTINRPSDWVRLVESYPKVASQGHLGWELPGPNQHVAEIRGLCAVTTQHAARVGRLKHVLPDWGAVASEYDGVHLTWAGFLTTEGFVSDLADGVVTMLRYWGSERTLWLRDVFGIPEPLASPELSGCVSGVVGNDADAGDEVRTRADLQWIAVTLGRQQPQ